VFRDLDFSPEFTLFHYMDVLAEEVVPWEGVSRTEVALVGEENAYGCLEKGKSWSARIVTTLGETGK
jgi:hypothetical protein